VLHLELRAAGYPDDINRTLLFFAAEFCGVNPSNNEVSHGT
jgi:hypothetical protein